MIYYMHRWHQKLSQHSKPDTRHGDLLALPSHIRHLIYRYALTFDSQPLFMREDTRIDKKLRSDSSVRYETQIALPVWANPPNSMKLCLTPDPHTEANQLKYVCRQLYRETRCLALAYNNAITFIRTHDQEYNALRQFARFVKHCSIIWTVRLRTIILRDTKPGQGFECRTSEDHLLQTWLDFLIEERNDPQHPLKIVADFCVAHSQVEVRWHNLYIHNQGDNWQDLWCRMVQIRTECSRAIPTFMYGDQTTDIYKNIVVPTSDMAVQLWTWLFLECGNVRIFPYEEHFNERKFRNQIARDVDVRRNVLSLVPGDINTWVRALRKLYREGF